MSRITILSLSLWTASVSLPAASAAQSSVLDPIRLVEEDRIQTGTYAGAYIVAPYGQLNWYFANLGLRAFAGVSAPKVRIYLNLYLAHLQADRTIRDVNEPTSAQPRDTLSDSDDSYAATFISLAVAYARASGNKAWFTAHLPVIREVAQLNLISNRDPATDLTYNLRPPRQPQVALLEDNSEVYAALRDLADYLKSIGDTTEAQTYSREAATTLGGIRTLFNPADSTWWTSALHAPLDTTCYPSSVGQVFPDAFGVPVPSRWRAVGYRYLNQHYRNWPTDSCGGFPWALLGYVAAIRHDSGRAQAKLTYMDQLAADPAGKYRGRLAIHELGWYRRTRDLCCSDR